MKKLSILVMLLALGLAGCARQNAANPTTDQMAATPPVQETTPDVTTVPAATADPDQVYISFSREGIVSTIPVTMVDGTVGSYRIATNPELFRMESYGSSDSFWYTLWEGQPNIYYSVSIHPDMTAEDVEAGLLHQNDGATSERVKIGQYDAIGVYTSENDPLMTQRHFYLIAHGNGCYMIETQFVMEMYEGLFPQMRALFDTFTILD